MNMAFRDIVVPQPAWSGASNIGPACDLVLVMLRYLSKEVDLRLS